MREWAAYVLLASGVMCLSMAWFARVPENLAALPGFAAVVGLLAVVTGFSLIAISRRDRPK
jgi:hypothetical protein